MAWIKFEKDLLTDPRVLRVARSLQKRWWLFDGDSIPEKDGFDSSNATALPAVTLVTGALIRLWSLADTHLREDEILPLGFVEIDEIVGVPGLCSLLPADWILEIDENTVKLPDFHAHNGIEAKKKAQTQKRVERFRNKGKPAPEIGNGPALPDHTRPDQTKPIEKPSAFALPDWVPVESWNGFVEMRKKSKSAFTERAKALLVSELFKLVEAGGNAAAILDQSTANGWKGVFPIKTNGGAGNGKAAGAPWWSSNEGIQAKAAELHVEPRKGESWNDLKARVNTAMGAQ